MLSFNLVSWVGSQSPVPHCQSPGSILEMSMTEFWWTTSTTASFSNEYSCSATVTVISSSLGTELRLDPYLYVALISRTTWRSLGKFQRTM